MRITGDNEAIYSYSEPPPAGPGAKTRKVWVTVDEDDTIEWKAATGSIKIVLEKKNGDVEVTFETDPTGTGQNLLMTTRTNIRAYLRVEGRGFRHPHKKLKIERIRFIPSVGAAKKADVLGREFSLVIQSSV